MECYERLKAKGEAGASMFNFMSTGITYATMDRASQDKNPAGDHRLWPRRRQGRQRVPVCSR